MKLPDEIMNGLNLAVSRHKHPDTLDWQLIRGVWTAIEGDRCFTILSDSQFGYVIAQTKSVAYSIGADLE
jgi:hypothetical protein